RDKALAAFKTGRLRVLVATDVAARGIDIPDVRHVYNYDLPNVPDAYVHRIGRTARAGATGRAVAFCAEAEIGDLRAIEKTVGLLLPVIGGDPWAEARPVRSRGKAGGKPGAGRRQGGHKPGEGAPTGAKPRNRRRRRRGA